MVSLLLAVLGACSSDSSKVEKEEHSDVLASFPVTYKDNLDTVKAKVKDQYTEEKTTHPNAKMVKEYWLNCQAMGGCYNAVVGYTIRSDAKSEFKPHFNGPLPFTKVNAVAIEE